MILLRAARYAGQVRLRLAYAGKADTGTNRGGYFLFRRTGVLTLFCAADGGESCKSTKIFAAKERKEHKDKTLC
jgi:hypothetical protein